MTLTAGLWIAGALTSGVTVGVTLWRRARRKSPEERERLRRLAVHSRGRLTDGELIDGPPDSAEAYLLYYTYRAAGIEYTAAQDVSSLLGFLSGERCCPGDPAVVKYDPRRPANSIVLCEQWSGLRQPGGPQARS